MAAATAWTAIADDLMKLLECPICMQELSAPIEICKNGHSVCKDCRKKVNKCPSCKSEFTGTRNFLAEGIAETLLYPCVNVEAGCSVRVFKKDLVTHGSKCPFRVCECFMKEETKCQWTGRRSEIRRHLKNEHTTWLHPINLLFHSPRSDGTENEDHIILVVSVHGEMFCYRNKYNADRKTRAFFVQFIGPEERASDFTFRIQLQSSDTNQNVIFSSNTHSDLKDVASIMEAGECLELRSVMIDKYFKTIKVEILKNFD